MFMYCRKFDLLTSNHFAIIIKMHNQAGNHASLQRTALVKCYVVCHLIIESFNQGLAVTKIRYYTTGERHRIIFFKDVNNVINIVIF